MSTAGVTKSYVLKDITWHDHIMDTKHKYKIICQNKNGPCPLIAICNVLILRGEVELPESWYSVDEEWLLGVLGEKLYAKASEEKPLPRDEAETADEKAETEEKSNDNSQNDLQKNIDDALGVIPRLCTGLDVNIKFDSVFSFEIQPELLVFDIFNIRLCHAWIPDAVVRKEGNVSPLEEPFTRSDIFREVAISNQSYNTLVDGIIRGKEAATLLSQAAVPANSDTQELQRIYETGLKYSDFLENSSSQVTVQGLETLGSSLPPSSIVVFFRNNHFSVLYKHMTNAETGEYMLLLLVTDQGYARHSNIVWESFDDILGDSHFYDGSFKEVVDINHETTADETNNDYVLALRLQQQLDLQDQRADMSSSQESVNNRNYSEERRSSKNEESVLDKCIIS